MVSPPIEPLLLPGGIPISFQVIPPVAEQEQAMRLGEPLSYFRGYREKGVDEKRRPLIFPGSQCPPNLMWRHRVVIPRPFYLGATPVTQAQFAAWTKSDAYERWRQTSGFVGGTHKNAFPGHPGRPADSVHWHEARAYTEWLNCLADAGRMNLPQGVRAMLPGEASWEYACRAGTNTQYWSGDAETALAEVGWYRGNAMESMEVGRLPANPWGLHDMHGNVAEWCEDAFDEAIHLPSPGWAFRGWADPGEGGPCRPARGGAWNTEASLCTSDLVWWFHPCHRSSSLGFRVMLSASGPWPLSAC